MRSVWYLSVFLGGYCIGWILQALAGPQLDAKCICGLATLGASLDIKVAKIEDVKDA